jgi:ABC-type dipeptide/oligopeptide/nickel transport system ATPase subunit
MTLKNIIEIQNKDYKKGKVLKEKMDIYIPDVKPYFSCRNGMVYCLVGSGGSGKTQLLMSLFKNKDAYYKNFHHIYYFTPQVVIYHWKTIHLKNIQIHFMN